MYDPDYSFLHPLDHPVPEINKRQDFYQKYIFNPLCVLLLRLLYVLFDRFILLFLILLLFHTLLIFSLQRTHCSRALGSMGAVRFCHFTIARYCFTIMEHMKSMIMMTVRILVGLPKIKANNTVLNLKFSRMSFSHSYSHFL